MSTTRTTRTTRRALPRHPLPRPMSATPSAAPRVTQLTPVMLVEQVEPSLAFWTERLGFAVENTVPGPDGGLLFASARRGAVEVMYQTVTSIAEEQPALAAALRAAPRAQPVTLFVAVDDLDAVERAMHDVPVVKARHTTFYGSDELYVREPGGVTVGFAQFTRGGAETDAR